MKLEFDSVSGLSDEFLRSYLSNRSQFVSLHTTESYRRGVPQGLVIGPILFSLNINDSVHASDKLKYVLFGDDTNICILVKR